MIEDSFLCGFDEYIPYTFDNRKNAQKILDLIDGNRSKIEIGKALNMNAGTLSREISQLSKVKKIILAGSKILNGKKTNIYQLNKKD